MRPDAHKPLRTLGDLLEPDEGTKAFLTPYELAGRWAVSAQTVRRWIRAGKLVAFKSPGGGGHRISLATVERIERGDE